MSNVSNVKTAKCPICNKKPSYSHIIDKNNNKIMSYYVECIPCSLLGQIANTRKKSIVFWNYNLKLRGDKHQQQLDKQRSMYANISCPSKSQEH